MYNEIEKIIKDLQSKEFNLFLPEIRLVDPNLPNSSFLKGMGIININEDSLYFKMYVAENKNIFDHSRFISDLAKHKDTNLCTFKANDTDSNSWEFTTFSFSENINFANNSMNSIYDEIKDLFLIDLHYNDKTNNYLSFYFGLNYVFPLNYEEKIIETSNDSIKSFYCKGKINCRLDSIEVESFNNNLCKILKFTTQSQDENFDVRILESLRFITGVDLSPYLVSCNINGTKYIKIFGDLRIKDDIKIIQPLKILDHKSPFAADSWKLFEKYLLFISHHKGPFLSKLSSLLNTLLGASKSYLSTKILVLCVRVEGIVEKELSNELNKRVSKSLQLMKGSSVTDKLRELKNIGVISETQLSSWKTLRNKYTHSGTISVSNVNDELKKYKNVFEMLYRIIFYAIGYSGEYTTSEEKEIQYKMYN